VAAWRRLEAHRAAKTRGRAAIFRDYGMRERAEAPEDSQAFHAATFPLR
jgi:hypothetical protein